MDALRGFLVTADMVIVAALGYAIYLIYVAPYLFNSRYFAAIGGGVLCTRLVLHWLGAYDEGVAFKPALHASRVFTGLLISFGILLATAFALKISDHFSRVCWCPGSFPARRSWSWDDWRFASSSVRPFTRVGSACAASFSESARRGSLWRPISPDLRDPSVRLLGFIEDRGTRQPEPQPGQEVLGGMEDLVGMIRRGEVDQVFLALPWTARERLRDIALRLSELPVHIRLAPDLAGFEFAGNSAVQVAGLPMVRLFDRPISGWNHVLKRLEDLSFATFGLILTGPLMVFVALAIKLDSPGPILFRQTRRGFNDNLFEVLKFRTMYTERSDADGAVQTKSDDPRVTRVGWLLRRMSLDELPQIFNVLRGDMSIVGPRPHALETKAAGFLFEEVVNRYASRHRVKPGITGWAQINGWRGETDTVEKIRKRVECDLYYIENWSLWLDLWIIVKTVPLMLGDRRAY